MSESGISNPAGPKTGGASLPLSVHEQPARLEQAPERLRDVRTERTLKGRVVGRNEDGSVRVRTPEGDIDVRIQRSHAKGTPLRAGADVEVDIPPGSPPPTVTIRRPAPAPDIASRQTTPPASPAVSRENPAPVQASVRHSSTPVTVELGLPARPASTAIPQAGISGSLNTGNLQAGQALRLIPTPLSQILPATPLENITASVMQNISFQASLPAIAANSQLLNQILSILPQPNELPPLTGLSTLVTTPLTTTVTPQTTSANLWQHMPGFSASSFSGSQASSVPATSGSLPLQSFLVPPSPASTFGQTSVTPPAGNAMSGNEMLPGLAAAPSRPEALDVQILNVLPSKAQIVPAASGNSEVQPLALMRASATGSILQNAQAGTMTATVIGASPQNMPVLSMLWPQSGALQTFTLQTSAQPLLPGMQLEVSPLPAYTFGPGPQSAALLLSEFLAPAPWPVFEETLQLLSQQDPQLAQAFTRILPNAANPAQLGAAALLFIAAARSGDLGSWMGERAMNILRRAEGRGSSITSRLSGEMSTNARVQAEPVSSDWRGMALPLVYHGEINKIALYWRDGSGSEQDPGKDKEKQTRFIFDLNLSQMGELQLDGLLRGRRLDLVVRTRAPLSAAMQQNMRRTYAGAVSSTGLEGDISFQDDPQRWVRVLQQDKALSFI